ncbi:DUF6114 domain-containing protein [Kitasatospora sp. GP82]|uniref:DUF6114 domain-containing protein n=1 Tax=Kitasatospora sp. GP82 TaxID=3035089 RepID=UPI0024771FDD|nr:DUF6114 domain-containing protein [Kitasatospora sp. GP82]
MNPTTDDLPRLLGNIAGARQRFRVWRGTRPFWAGLLTSSASAPIMYFPYTHLTLAGLPLALSTTAGAGSLVIGILLVVLGITLWLQPQMRVFAGVATILLALISVPVANFGGFLLGLLPALIGGSLACAWAPPSEARETYAPSAAAEDRCAAVPYMQAQGMAPANSVSEGHGGE